LSIADNAVLDKIPAVTSTDGSKVEDSLIALPDNPVASGGVVNALAENGHAKASVTDLGVGDGLLAQLPQQLTDTLGTTCTQLAAALEPVTTPIGDLLNQLAPGLDGLLQQVADATKDTPLNLGALGALDLTKLTSLDLKGLCTVLSGDAKLVGAGAVEAECNGNTGTTTIADLSALGLPVDIGTSQANQSITIPDIEGVPPLVDLTINRQTKNADGTFTVDALNLNLLGQVDVTVASATCGKVTNDKPKDPNDAPSPSPVKTHVPVTG
ncbi:MAG: hypothetical protein L0H31_09490, partial [Nocardioidaceae bacterium]|nr:hypothetical protein [Nocardioidaceae bacterium]